MANEWISVKDKLPGHTTDVLVYTESGEVVVTWYWVDRQQWDYCTHLSGNAATHWMPLPEPPQQERGWSVGA